MKMLQLSQTAKPTVWKAVVSLTLVALVIIFYACRSQDSIIPSKNALTEVDQMPVYEGGVDVLNRYLQQTLRYPSSARKDAVQGEVIVAYTVTKRGTVENVEIVKSVRKDLDEEVKRVISNLKNTWTPGKKGDKEVDVRMTLPINFMLKSQDGQDKVGSAGDAAVVVVGYLPKEVNMDGVFVAVEHMPEFPGGIEGMGKFLSENLKYPKTSRENGIYGKVFIAFVVREDGTLANIEITKGVNDEIDAEAIRVIKLMPKWIPGRQSGREVPVQYMLPIAFSLGK